MSQKVESADPKLFISAALYTNLRAGRVTVRGVNENWNPKFWCGIGGRFHFCCNMKFGFVMTADFVVGRRERDKFCCRHDLFGR